MLRSCPAWLTRVTARRLSEAEERSWLVAAVEAEDVVLDGEGGIYRHIFARYVELGSVHARFRISSVSAKRSRLSP